MPDNEVMAILKEKKIEIIEEKEIEEGTFSRVY